MHKETTTTVELLEANGCRLCGEAGAIVRAVLKRQQYVLRAGEILDGPQLERGYSTRIPVLRRTDTGAEREWAIGQEDVYRFLF